MTFTKFARGFAALAGVVLLSTGLGFAQEQPTGIEAAWSQMSGVPAKGAQPEEPAALNMRMRFVLMSGGGASCDTFQAIVRGDVQNVSWETRETRTLDSILVCDAPMGADWPEAKLVLADGSAARMAGLDADVVFPGPAAVGRRQLAQRRGDLLSIAVFGDSGCNGTFDPRTPQDCSDAEAWQFPRLIEDAMLPGTVPDFAIHLGNMRFDRIEDPNWSHWKMEFFAPAQPLLSQVPFAFARGNQEACSNREAGFGWFLLFGNSGGEGGVDTCDSRTGRMPVWYFDVAVRSALESSAPQRIIMIDSSGQPDRDLTRDFEQGLALAWQEGAPDSWVVSHRPIWGLDTFSGFMQQQSDPDMVSGFARAVKALPNGGCKPFKAAECGLKAILSGHQHAFENVIFPGEDGDGLPQQIVVGMSGVKLQPAESNSVFRFDTAGLKGRRERELCGSVANWASLHGYLVLESGVSEPGAGMARWRGEARLISEEGVLAPIDLIGTKDVPSEAAACF